MITIPMLTKESLTFLKGKHVVLYSQRAGGIRLYKCLKHCGVDVLCSCKEEKLTLQRFAKDKIRGLLDLTPEQLSNYIEKYGNVIIQSNEFDSAQIQHAHDVAKQLGVEFSSVTSGEIINSFSCLLQVEEFKNPLCYLWFRFSSKKAMMKKSTVEWNYFRKEKHYNPIIIVSPQKTADHSVNFTFENINQGARNTNDGFIDFFNLWHIPRYIDISSCEKKFGKTKILVGVREPISQNLSLIYQRFSAGFDIRNWMLLEMFNARNKKEVVEKYSLLLDQSINDVQAFWDAYINIYVDTKGPGFGTILRNGFIQWFFPEFSKHILDITAYPFNQEKGYTIIKAQNIEVFVYQLEKLNTFVSELSEWVGVPFDKLEKGNAAEDKWIAESYKQAQKEIEITQEYFDKCFNEPYVKHCYCEADIEKFKARWRPHIKKDVQ